MAVSLAPNVGKWWECSGDELWAMNLRRSNFVAQGDKCDCIGGNQAASLTLKRGRDEGKGGGGGRGPLQLYCSKKFLIRKLRFFSKFVTLSTRKQLQYIYWPISQEVKRIR